MELTEQQMLKINHKGTWCWIEQDLFCEPGFCSRCQVYDEYSQITKLIENGRLEQAFTLPLVNSLNKNQRRIPCQSKS